MLQFDFKRQMDISESDKSRIKLEIQFRKVQQSACYICYMYKIYKFINAIEQVNVN